MGLTKYKIYTSNQEVFLNNKIKLQQKLQECSFCHFEYDDNNPEIIFILGGDGTFINFINKQLDCNVKVVCINFGTLGFYSSYDNIESINIKDIIDDSKYQSPYMLKIRIDHTNYYAINELSLYSNTPINFETYINDVYLQTFKGSGMIINTPSGSTGKSKSGGGSVILPNQKAYALNEVFPINHLKYLSLRSPIILSHEHITTIKNFKTPMNLNISIDGQEISNFKYLSEIEVKLITSKIKIYGFNSLENYIQKLRATFIKEN